MERGSRRSSHRRLTAGQTKNLSGWWQSSLVVGRPRCPSKAARRAGPSWCKSKVKARSTLRRRFAEQQLEFFRGAIDRAFSRINNLRRAGVFFCDIVGAFRRSVGCRFRFLEALFGFAHLLLGFLCSSVCFFLAHPQVLRPGALDSERLFSLLKEPLSDVYLRLPHLFNLLR